MAETQVEILTGTLGRLRAGAEELQREAKAVGAGTAAHAAGIVRDALDELPRTLSTLSRESRESALSPRGPWAHLPQDTRRVRYDERRAEAVGRARSAVRVAQDAAEGFGHALLSAAMPTTRADAQDRMLARQLVELGTKPIRTGAGLVDALVRQVAASGWESPEAAEIVGPWGRAFLQSRGVDASLHDVIRHRVALSAVESPGAPPQARAAAQLLAKVEQTGGLASIAASAGAVAAKLAAVSGERVAA